MSSQLLLQVEQAIRVLEFLLRMEMRASRFGGADRIVETEYEEAWYYQALVER
jgi:hypothetical protein